ncbi:MAG: methyltransferase domain-containing protein [Acidobacteria bacterium]|nr:methyltransferase domain-containing protein [Acidobacteriota bacterium]
MERSRRIIEREWLDDTPIERARSSLNDLVRINRWLGGHRTLRRMLAGLTAPDEVFSLLDVGAASGDGCACVRSWYPRARVTCMDYRAGHLRGAPPKVVADAFRLPLRGGSFDFVYCALFLHHFSDQQVVELLRSFSGAARRAVLVNDLERHPLPYHFVPATRWLFRWDPITLHDAPISVQAGFTPDELRDLAVRAGLRNVRIRGYRPAFRLALIGEV